MSVMSINREKQGQDDAARRQVSVKDRGMSLLYLSGVTAPRVSARAAPSPSLHPCFPAVVFIIIINTTAIVIIIIVNVII